jgi:hypothetical protein
VRPSRVEECFAQIIATVTQLYQIVRQTKVEKKEKLLMMSSYKSNQILKLVKIVIEKCGQSMRGE